MTSVLSNRSLRAKGLTACASVAAAVLLPQAVHTFLGVQGGKLLLPMYFPVLLAACILGLRWGVCVAVGAPLISFAMTAPFGLAMPSAAMLPWITVELVVFSVVAGSQSKRILTSDRATFAAVFTAQLAGRGTLLLYFAHIGNVAGGLAQIKAGWFGLVLQLLLIPIFVKGIKKGLSFYEG